MLKPRPGSQINWGHSLSNNLTGAFLFNEGSGITTYDYVNGVKGVLAGTVPPTWGAEFEGPVLNFNGGASTNSYVDCGTPGSLLNLALQSSLGGPLGSSIFVRAMWDGSSPEGGLVQRRITNGTSGWLVGGLNNFDNKAFTLIHFSSTQEQDEYSLPIIGQWFNLLITWDNANTLTTSGGGSFIKTYLNGQLVNIARTGQINGSNTTDASDEFYIGRSDTQSFDFVGGCWSGKISTVALWKNRILTDMDAAMLNKNPWAYMTPTPKIWWRSSLLLNFQEIFGTSNIIKNQIVDPSYYYYDI